MVACNTREDHFNVRPSVKGLIFLKTKKNWNRHPLQRQPCNLLYPLQLLRGVAHEIASAGPRRGMEGVCSTEFIHSPRFISLNYHLINYPPPTEKNKFLKGTSSVTRFLEGVWSRAGPAVRQLRPTRALDLNDWRKNTFEDFFRKSKFSENQINENPENSKLKSMHSRT